jgi:hypothetical protein
MIMKRILTIIFALALLAPAIAQAQTLTSFERNGKWGYQNVEDWQVVIPLKYDYASDFSEGLAAVELNGKWGAIDKTDKVVIPLMYEYVGYFSEGLAVVQLGGKRGHIDKTGKVVIPIEYIRVSNFSEGLAAVTREAFEWKYVYIDKTGQTVFATKYEWVREFSDGFAMVKFNEKYGYIALLSTKKVGRLKIKQIRFT